MKIMAVDMIRNIRRAYFEQQLPIKEIVRTLSVSRSTVRKLIRRKAKEFQYARDAQPDAVCARLFPHHLQLGRRRLAAGVR